MKWSSKRGASQEWILTIGEKLQCQREKANKQNPYALAIVKRTAAWVY